MPDTTPHTPEVDPGYVRELLAVIRELVDAAIAARPYVKTYRDAAELSPEPRYRHAGRVLDELDGAIAEGQNRL
jgi:hypothetical protein